MLKKLIAGILLIFTAGCLPTLETRQIIVDGEATLEFTPDTFLIGAEIRSRGDNQREVLGQISKSLADIREKFPNLEGLTHLTIDAQAAEITPVLNAECMEKSDYGMKGKCPIDAYFGSIQIAVKGSPARLSGYSLSLLSELGADSVRLSGYSLDDQEAAQQQVLDAAVKNARHKAEKIAGADGSKITGAIRIQYGEGFPDRDGRGGVYYEQALRSPDAVSSNQTVVPETELDLDPKPIKIESRVTAAFEIE